MGAKEPNLPPFERVIDLHGPALLRFCAERVGLERGEDCFQESMLAALRGYAQLRDASSIRPWLFAIAARKAIDMHRSGERVPLPTDQVEHLVVEPAAARDDSLDARIRNLPDKQREAVTLRYFGELSHKEIAEIMGTSEEAARRSVFEGLSRLREALAR